MATSKVFTKQLAASGSTNIATSQSVSANTTAVLNGTAASFLSTTSTAAALPGATVIPLTSVTGIVVGAIVSDSTTASAFVMGTVVTAVGTSSVQVWPPVAGAAGVGNGDTIVFSGIATIDTATSTNSAIGRRVVVAYSGTDTTFAVVGTNSTGNTISDTITGVSGAGQSNLDFVTVTSITPAGSVTGFTAGTNTTGSSPWWPTNIQSNNDVNIGFGVEVIGSGTVNYSVQHSYDDPNNLLGGATFPEAFNHPVVANQNASLDGSYTWPVSAIRVIINSFTGTVELRVRILQAGIG
jgi:hypothetical protein